MMNFNYVKQVLKKGINYSNLLWQERYNLMNDCIQPFGYLSLKIYND